MILLTNVIQSLWLKNKVKREEGYLPVAAPALPGQEELLRLPLARDNGWWPATSQPLLVFTLPCFGIRKSALNNNQLYYFSRWSWDFNRNAFKLKSIGLECSGQHGTVQVEYFCPFHLSVLAVIHLNWLLHHHHALERPICTFICTPHCNAQYVRGCHCHVTARAERMSRMTDDQYLRSRAWKPLYKTPFPGHWVVSIKKVDNLWKRRWMIFAFKETILSRFVTIKEVVSVSKKPISYPSRKLYKEDMKLSKLNGTSQSILINFFVTMDRPAGWLHHKSVAIREAKKTKHCEFFWHSPTATIPTASACTRNICTTNSNERVTELTSMLCQLIGDLVTIVNKKELLWLIVAASSARELRHNNQRALMPHKTNIPTNPADGKS